MVAVLIIPQHFEKYRAVAFGCVSASSGFGNMIFPWLIQSLTRHYGWRGGVLLLSGLFLNICVLSMFFKNKEMTNNDMDMSDSEKPKENTNHIKVPTDDAITKSLTAIKKHVKGLKKAKFWIFYIGVMLQLCGYGIVYTHIVAFTESIYRGQSTNWSSLIVTLIAAFTICE